MKPAKPENGFLRMCVDCQHSRMYHASNNRTIWYFCNFHGVVIHYNESCEKYAKMQEETKSVNSIQDFPRFPSDPSSPGKEGIR